LPWGGADPSAVAATGDPRLTGETIIARARGRGEITVDLPPRVTGLPFELLRGEVLMTMHPLSEESITTIVDEVFLPLVSAYQNGLAGADAD
ncbi:MAG: TetR/AcrR family transcriptional regulator C-terminal ligand-binding domain-containing protein, partial [Acidipropionibacterium jensenii]|nr:TetR/AcrR family transcriptional regulator C-terminal ligand-binding domain-containing protein [Acidipropionibacterium jensenii]